jgi:hypothetical protein
MARYLTDSVRAKAHAQKMLRRAERRLKQAARLVEKWQMCLSEAERDVVRDRQLDLWTSQEEPADESLEAIPSGRFLPTRSADNLIPLSLSSKK